MIQPIEIVELGQRVVLGGFFLVSGGHKLFHQETRRKFAAFFGSLGVGEFKWVVASGEFTGGLALLVGCFTPFACLGLTLILCGAIYLDVWKTDIAGKHPKDPTDWYAKIVDCPEILMLGWLASIVLLGPGTFSVDHVVMSLFT